jgi:hypothetical protein
MVRGARALAIMDTSFSQAKRQSFACAVTPMSCTLHRVPKAGLEKAFGKIFQGNIPRGLEPIFKRSKKERAAFRRELKKLPDTYVTCD